MPSNQTPNYALNQWERDDRILMEDFNADNAKIDTALAGLAETAAAHGAALALRGNCRIGTLTYTGTGEDGEGAYITLTFPARPVIFFAFGPRCLFIAQREGKDNMVFARYLGSYSTTFTGSSTTITWTGNTAQISVPDRMPDLNAKDYVHNVIAFYAEDA